MPLHLQSPGTPSASADAQPGSARPAAVRSLTRRSFLALSVLGWVKAAGAMRLPYREQTWALVSDTHISSMLDRSVRASTMSDNLKRVVEAIGVAGPDCVLFNGDVAFAKGRLEDYAAFLELIGPLKAQGLPLHLTLGNHDARGRFVEALTPAPEPAVEAKCVDEMAIEGVRWFFLDSLERVNAVRGSLGPAQLAWLARRLDADPAPAIVCVHHNPDRSAVGLKDADEFMGVVAPRRQVKLVICGHTHRFRVWQTEGLHFVNLPATGFRINPAASLGWVLARIGEDGMGIAFRGLTGKERAHGSMRYLSWRSLTSGG